MTTRCDLSAPEQAHAKILRHHRSAAHMAGSAGVETRAVGVDALDAANDIVAAAIGTWDIASRVKRLVMPSYLYTAEDLQHLDVLGAWIGDALVGLVAIEQADPADTPAGQTAMLVHGLYVEPGMHGLGIGRRLMDTARKFARDRGATGLLVRAERSAVAFFLKQGLARLPVMDQQRGYPHQLWWNIVS